MSRLPRPVQRDRFGGLIIFFSYVRTLGSRKFVDEGSGHSTLPLPRLPRNLPTHCLREETMELNDRAFNRPARRCLRSFNHGHS